MDRKDFLKSLGVLTAGAALLGAEETLKAAPVTADELDFPLKGLKAKVKEPVKVIIIGAGNRGRYGHAYGVMTGLRPEGS